MARGRILTDEGPIRDHLLAAKTIAVAWVSPKPDRDSHKVAIYLSDNGYRVLPVRPGQKRLLGLPVFRSLADITEPVDIVDVFRNAAHVMEMAKAALLLEPRLVWMQEGIEHFGAALMLNAAGIDVVMNRCIKVDHEQLCRGPIRA
ncbi:MAG: CoA-binding protein [Desulfobacterales bacterium]